MLAAEQPQPVPGQRRPASTGGREPVLITGLGATSAYGRGTQALIDGVLTGEAAFAPVARFEVGQRRARFAATLPGAPDLAEELVDVVAAACAAAGLGSTERAGATTLLALHSAPTAGRSTTHSGPSSYGGIGAGAFATEITQAVGLPAPAQTYTSACVAASTAVADAAAMIARGQTELVVVATGYLVDPDQFALFDAGRALATDGAVRPFSRDRKGILLGDGVAAVVVESASSARRRGATALARLAGWARSGDAYHVCQPRPDGTGLARAIRAALDRAGVAAEELDYVNAHGSGSPQSDAAEANALLRALGPVGPKVAVSSTKALHGQALEASPLLELIVTVLCLARGQLPRNAGFLGPDEACPLNLVLDRESATAARPPLRWAMSLNSAFGGANTALLVGAPL